MSDLDSICLDGLISGSNLSNLSRWASGLDISQFGFPDSRFGGIPWQDSCPTIKCNAIYFNKPRILKARRGAEGAPSDGQREALSVATARSAVRWGGAKRRPLLPPPAGAAAGASA